MDNSILPTKTVYENGTIEYRLPNGELHREDGPARIWSDGCVEYWIDGKLHRADGPAMIWPSGTIYYFVNGKLHRTDGPAMIWSNGSVDYFISGKKYTKEEFEAFSD